MFIYMWIGLRFPTQIQPKCQLVSAQVTQGSVLRLILCMLKQCVESCANHCANAVTSSLLHIFFLVGYGLDGFKFT